MKSIIAMQSWVILFAVTAKAEMIYIDFGDDTVGLSNYSAAGPAPGEWNDITALGLTSGLINAAGTTTSVNLSLVAGSASGSFGSGSSDNDEILLSDNSLSSAGNPWSVALDGLQNGMYDIYYYEPLHPLVRTGAFEINGVAAVPLDASIDVLMQGVSWQVATTTVSDGTLFLASTESDGFRGLAGLQVVASVPEPTVPAMIFGLTGLFVATRRRR
ncbi:MAG: PEP-CTERM sorting domain-containing protein [Planctomycetota bacterium]